MGRKLVHLVNRKTKVENLSPNFLVNPSLPTTNDERRTTTTAKDEGRWSDRGPTEVRPKKKRCTVRGGPTEVRPKKKSVRPTEARPFWRSVYLLYCLPCVEKKVFFFFWGCCHLGVVFFFLLSTSRKACCTLVKRVVPVLYTLTARKKTTLRLIKEVT